MKDYKTIISEITAAVKDIEDEKLKEIAFQRLLEHALTPLPTPSLSTTSIEEGSDSNGKSAVIDLVKVKKSDMIRVKKASTVATPYNLKVVRQDVIEAFQDIHGKYPGLKPYGELKQKLHKYFWILEIGRLKGIEALTNSEIAYLLDTHFREGVTEKQVTNLGAQLKYGFIQRREVNGLTAWRILKDGTDLVTEGNEENGSYIQASN